MKRLTILLFAALASSISSGAATAACAYGNQTIGGSIGPGQTDPSRSFTIEGPAILIVSGATDEGSRPVDLQVTFPGHCRQRSGPTVSCTVSAYGAVNAVITNPTRHQVTYDWVCVSQ